MIGQLDAVRRRRRGEFAIPEGLVQFSCLPRLWSHRPRGDRMELIIACAWCGRVRLDDWVDAEEANRVLLASGSREAPRFSHGICADCFDEVSALRAAAHVVAAEG